MEVNTNQQFYHKLGYIFVEIPKFLKNESELETDQDYWLYLLKNLEYFHEIPVALSDKEEFIKFFKIAEVSNLSQKDMDAYQQSLKIQRDNYSTQKTAVDRAEAKGKRENAIEVALILKQKGISVDIIAESTKLTIKEIEAL